MAAVAPNMNANPTPTANAKPAATGPINRYKKITETLQSGYNITKISIPSYHQADDVVVYEVDVSNKKLRWNLWLRFESFHLLHQMMLELVAELSTPDNPLFLPPFPEKRLKIFVDHFDEEFIEQRKMLLENYLRKILANPYLKHSEIFISFLTPPENEDFEVTQSLPAQAAKDGGDMKENALESTSEKLQDADGDKTGRKDKTDMTNNNDDDDDDDDDQKKETMNTPGHHKEYDQSLLNTQMKEQYFSRSDLKDLSTEDEITGVSIPQAQVLKNDHTIYQIHVENINKRSSFSSWTVLKRYGEFFAFDHNLRQALLAQPHEYAMELRKMPRLPPKRLKVVIDHLDQTFIEKRRLLLQCYLKRLVRNPKLRRHELTMDFLGVS